MILTAKEIGKSFGERQVLSDIHLTIEPKTSIAILGKSGSGKTTLLHILSTLEEPSRGILELNGKPIQKKHREIIRNKHMGFIFQNFNLLEDFTPLENVLMPARIARKTPLADYGLHLLQLVGLEEKAYLSTKLLSGGEKQRLSIARSLCNRPTFLFADEPTGNLDRENSENIAKLLISLNLSLVIATHDPYLASLCDKKYLLKDGLLYLSSI